MQFITQLVALAIIRYEVFQMASPLITFFQIALNIFIYAVLCLSAVIILHPINNLQIPTNAGFQCGTSLFNAENNDIYASGHSIAAITEMLLILDGDVELIPGPTILTTGEINEKIIKCDQCPKVFSDNGSLRRHKRTVHVVIYSEKHGENIYKCIMHLNSYNI